ncbi:MAG: hypothetical protein MZV64_44080 [Ignavibacteriales bacterium]|nr:hypothetical protein [Ignavibacteriales bacterium]
MEERLGQLPLERLQLLGYVTNVPQSGYIAVGSAGLITGSTDGGVLLRVPMTCAQQTVYMWLKQPLTMLAAGNSGNTLKFAEILFQLN